MQPLLQEGRKLIFHDYKTVRKYVGEWGIETPLCDFDVMLAEYVLNPTQRNYSLEKLRTKYGAAGYSEIIL